MTLDIKDFQTNDTLFSFSILRFSMNDTVICATMNDGFKQIVPVKGVIYKIVHTDTDTSTVIEKAVLFSGYHFLMDKDGENSAHITDNSLIFQILG